MREAICVGVDWGRSKHAYSLRTSDGQECTGAFPARAEAVHEWIRELRAKHPEGTIVIAVEQSRGSFSYALQQYDFVELVPVNPRAAKAYRDALHLSGAKDDPTDAALLRDFVLMHRNQLRTWRADEEGTRKLALLVEGRRKLVDLRTSNTQAFTAALGQYFPQILDWFDDPISPLARAFLRQWSILAAVSTASHQSILRLVRTHSRKKPEAVEILLAAIRSAVALTTDQAIIEPMSRLALAYLEMIEALDTAIRGYNSRIAELTAEHPDQAIFASFPGAGSVIVPRLIAAFGTDRSRWTSASDLQSYSGIAPVIERSGQKSWTHARFHCPRFLRQTFHEFAQSSLPHCPWALAFYRLQRSRGAAHHALSVPSPSAGSASCSTAGANESLTTISSAWPLFASTLRLSSNAWPLDLLPQMAEQRRL